MTDKSKDVSGSDIENRFGHGPGRYLRFDGLPVHPIIPAYGDVKFEHQRGHVLSLSEVSDKETFFITPLRDLRATEVKLEIESDYTKRYFESLPQTVELNKQAKFAVPKSAFGPAGFRVWFIVRGAHDLFEPLDIVP